MLTLKTVELITNFDGWEYPNFHRHKEIIDGHTITTVERWSCSYVSVYYEDKSLNKDEQKSLEELLIQNPKSEIYEVVSDYIQWVLKNFPFGGYDNKDHMFDYWMYEYFYLGRKNCSVDETPFNEVNGFNDSKCRVHFWDKHYRTEYFEKTLPHYVETLRRLLD